MKMATHNDYIAYLEENGYTEEEVLQMCRPEEHTREDNIATGLAISLMTNILQSNPSKSDAKYAKFNLEALTANTNHLLQGVIDARLKKRFGETRIEHSANIFAGVFPTNDFNARAVRKYPGLVLLDTACFEIIEAGAWIYMSTDSPASKASRLRRLVERLVAERKLHRAAELDHPSLRGPGSAGRKLKITSVVTAAEEFVLAHEYAHFALGHYEAEQLDRHEMELAADRWAFNSLIRPNSLWPDTQSGMEEQIAGAFLFLGLAGVVKMVSEKNNCYNASGYPSPAERFGALSKLVVERQLSPRAMPGLGLAFWLLNIAEGQEQPEELPNLLL